MAPASTEPTERSPVYAARPRWASIPLVASADSRAVPAAASSASEADLPSWSCCSSVSVAGTSASRRVLSPTSEFPRCLMPSIDARSAATTSSPRGLGLSASDVPARRNAVPQIGPDVPPMRFVRTMAVFLRRPPGSVYSSASQSLMTISNPRASEYPKSPSPTTASSSQKYFSLSTAVWAMTRTTNCACLSATSSLIQPPSPTVIGCDMRQGR
jgi:hypothetical protein